MLKKIALGIGIVLVVGILAVLGIASTKPDIFAVERSATIQAPPEAIYEKIVDFHKWPEWSPWENIDPAMKRTYSGSESGKGAKYAWVGNDEVGSGQMEIQDVTEPTKITIKLDFIKPFEASNTTVFTMEPKDGSTTVTWSMSGPNQFIGKVMQIFINCEKMCGDQFETGLNKLKTIAEKKS